MSEQDFVKSIFAVAEGLLKRKITETEKEKLIKLFNESNKENAHLRAIDSLEKTFKIELPKTPGRVLLEKTAHFDDINNKLSEMRAEADKWEKEEKDSNERND